MRSLVSLTHPSEDVMTLELTTDDARILRDIVHDYLLSVRREAARTEDRDMRHDLVMRQDLCERLIPRLDDSPYGTT
jgi:hypothetical protein